MTVTEDKPVLPPGLVARVKAILLRPKDEWAVIDAEPTTVRAIYFEYLAIVAAIGPLARLIGDVVFLHVPIAAAVISAFVSYVLWLVLAYALAWLIDILASRFGGERSRVQAFKVAAYSSTASAVAGVFAIIPALSWLAIVGLYGLYLLWLGLPKLMRVPQEKALGYYAAVLGVLLAAGIVLGAVLAPVLMMSRFAP